MKRKLVFLKIIIKLLLDISAVTVAVVTAYWFRFNIDPLPVTKGVPAFEFYFRALPIIIIVFVAVLQARGMYKENLLPFKTDEFLNIFKSVLLSVVILTAGTFIYREYQYSRLVIVYFSAFAALLIYFNRRVISFVSSRIGHLNILVVGAGRIGHNLTRKIERSDNIKVTTINEFDPALIISEIKKNRYEEVVIVDSNFRREGILELINYCEYNDIDFRIVPDILELKMGEMIYDDYFGVPVLCLKHPLFEPSNYYFKRIFDILVSMSILLLSAPFLLFLVFMIKIDSPGPVFYYQKRKGYKGREFDFFKFRSMVQDADDKLQEVMNLNERSGPVFKMKCDPRVTRVGKFIRKYSIDEIPQILNVLKGDMSLVGPRPQVLWEAEAYDNSARRRLNILPGITGLWQVSGRSELSYEDMIRLDLYYLENWSPGFDMKILLKTIPVVVLKKGAC